MYARELRELESCSPLLVMILRSWVRCGCGDAVASSGDTSTASEWYLLRCQDGVVGLATVALH